MMWALQAQSCRLFLLFPCLGDRSPPFPDFEEATVTLGSSSPKMTDRPPLQVQADLAVLRAALDKAIPPRVVDRNLLITT